MARQIVVGCDGTWNVPDEARQGVAVPANVAKLALCVALGRRIGMYKLLHAFHRLRELRVDDAPGQLIASSA